MSQFILERDTLKAFIKTINSDMIKYNLNNLNNNFQYLF